MTATSELQVLKTKVEEQNKQLEVATKALSDLKDTLSKTRSSNHPHPNDVFGLPNIRNGENSMSSRGFSFGKMLGVITGAVPVEEAKVELDVHSRLHNCYVKELGSAGYSYAGGGHPGQPGGRFLAPLSTAFMQTSTVPASFRHEMKSLVYSGVVGSDPEEASWIRRKVLSQHYGSKALSWLNELAGGSLVAPPEMGELIELLRNQEALVNAGARVVPLPPQGRLKYPRQTAASLTYWIGENAPIPDSNIGTGEVTLQAKKLAVMIISPNELLRFASPAAEALIRDDMTKSLALALDLAGLEGAGGDHRPKGLINHAGINRISSNAPGANGDRLLGQDIYRFVAAIEESNAEMEGFIMRPKTLYKYYQLRSDSVAQGDGQGPFLFNLIREPSEALGKPMLAGFPVTKSTQVSQSQVKGNASNLTYIAWGMWSDMLIGMFGAMEFAATTMGDTPFRNDQTWIRGIVSADVVLRHEAAFGICQNLDVTTP